MAQLAGDGQAGLPVDVLHLRAQLLRGRAAHGRRAPAGQFKVAGLRIGMPQPMNTVDARKGGLGVPYVT